MRYIIYGAGGIGSIMGGHLFRTGHNVILIGRKGHVDAVNTHGLKLVTPTGTYELKIPAVTSPEDIRFQKGDVVCLCMKSQDTEAALQGLKGASSTVPIFCFQNGVSNEKTALKYYSDVYGVMVRVARCSLRMERWSAAATRPAGTSSGAIRMESTLCSNPWPPTCAPRVI
jgi:2-dehydropantoate 2-reductase